MKRRFGLKAADGGTVARTTEIVRGVDRRLRNSCRVCTSGACT